MIRLALFLLTLALSTSISRAQDVPSEGWPIEQRCLGDLPYPTIPQSRWSFEGVIFSQNSEGIRAIRTDVNRSYFVALEGGDSWPSAGAFSPDGRWFAYPIGHTSYSVNAIGDNAYGVEAIQVVSTDPARTSYVVEWMYFARGSEPGYALPPLQWLDNEQFIYEGERESGGGVINAITGEIQPWEKKSLLHNLFLFSPDFTRAFHWDYYSDQLIRLYSVENDTLFPPLESERFGFQGFVVWLPDSSGFVGQIIRNDAQADTTSGMLTLFDRDGNVAETIFSGFVRQDAISPDGNRLAFTANNQLFVADMENHVIYDLCFTMLGEKLAWSPDNIHLVFTYDGYPIILDTETLEMQILRYETGEILGWYPLD